MDKKLNNIFLLQEIIRELKTNNPKSIFWNKISNETWRNIIKKLFEKECFNVDGHVIKGLERYSGYASIKTLSKINKGTKEELKYQPLIEGLSKALKFDVKHWEDGITKEDLHQRIQVFKNKFEEPTEGRGGRSLYSGGNETSLLRGLIEEIIDQDFLGTYEWKSIIAKIAPNTIIDTKVGKSISHWKNKGGGISNEKYIGLKKDIADTLMFDMKYWEQVYALNVENVINKFKKTYLERQKLKLDLGDLNKYIPDNQMNKEEKNALYKLKEAQSLRDVLKFFDTPEYNKIYEVTPSDYLLQKSLEILYELGAYRVINDKILMKFSDNLYTSPEMKLFRAHVYGSEQVEDYIKAIHTLNDIEEVDMDKFADNKTALISNILRHALNTLDSDTDDEILQNILVEITAKYSDIFQKAPHYYPGINYAYMLEIGSSLFPKAEIFKDDTIEALYLDSKESIHGEKTSESTFDRYYATITESEFNALQGNFSNEDQEKLKTNLIDINPTQDTLIRTIRQIVFYENILEKRGKKAKQSVTDLRKFLEIFKN